MLLAEVDVMQAIQHSHMVTADIWEADRVYVFDYCYYAWWLAHVRTTGGDFQDSPGVHLVKVLLHK